MFSSGRTANRRQSALQKWWCFCLQHMRIPSNPEYSTVEEGVDVCSSTATIIKYRWSSQQKSCFMFGALNDLRCCNTAAGSSHAWIKDVLLLLTLTLKMLSVVYWIRDCFLTLQCKYFIDPLILFLQWLNKTCLKVTWGGKKRAIRF